MSLPFDTKVKERLVAEERYKKEVQMKIPFLLLRLVDHQAGQRGASIHCFNEMQVGAADYIALARNYHTVFIFDIPAMSMRICDKQLLLMIYFKELMRGRYLPVKFPILNRHRRWETSSFVKMF
ncbi:hypothetical protein AQUCO_06200020v1 [Aquilegia coerulea]|uniref:Uncharacterized protein n=1 Tax=Aquilegia coerulea TaxID=218851 RepID=A0A2G5CCZ2_AQUCA|nr:hypothetical protein AQUCO_06200020v1 [Aquilegia coerulea]